MATVRIAQTDKQFSAEGAESLLNAALRSGLDLPYGCASGNCGLCQAQLVSGSVTPIQHSDFVPEAAEQLPGGVLLCCHAADSDELEIALPETGPAPAQQLSAKVRTIAQAGNDILLLRLRLARSARLRFRAGQYARLTLPGGAQSDSAMANCPCEERFVDFQLRRLPDDPFSEEAFASLRAGDAIAIDAPHGAFAVNEDSPLPIVFIAFDTGFAAIRSLLEQHTARESDRPLHLLRICCSQADLYLNNLCRSWEDALDEFTYTAVILEQAEGRPGVAGVGDAARGFFARLPAFPEYDVYVCAPEEAVEQIEHEATELGLPRARLHGEIVRGNAYSRCLTQGGA